MTFTSCCLVMYSLTCTPWVFKNTHTEGLEPVAKQTQLTQRRTWRTSRKKLVSHVTFQKPFVIPRFSSGPKITFDHDHFTILPFKKSQPKVGFDVKVSSICDLYFSVDIYILIILDLFHEIFCRDLKLNAIKSKWPPNKKHEKNNFFNAPLTL